MKKKRPKKQGNFIGYILLGAGLLILAAIFLPAVFWLFLLAALLIIGGVLLLYARR
ncbi:MAG: hypothetical protein LBD85_00810 [Oscillospiraceae bacterium]|jgi:uncharacterized membrane protein YecN with MAPEG domain|nr:hypothetical protein [Oscillospiraceae bacterium]